jgi:hypothetical protein
MIRKAAALTLLAILTGCATVDTTDRLVVGMTKSELRTLLTWSTTLSDDPFINRDGYYSENEIEIVSAGESARIHYVFVRVTRGMISGVQPGNGILHSWHTTRSDARAEVARIIRSRMAKSTSYGAVPETNSKQASKQGNAKPVTPGKRRVAPLID